MGKGSGRARGCGEREGTTRGSGEVEVHRRTRGTAAAWRAPVINCGSLVARFEGKKEGNGGGEAGLFIESKMARNPALKRRQSRPENVPVPGAGSSREEDDGDVTDDITLR